MIIIIIVIVIIITSMLYSNNKNWKRIENFQTAVQLAWKSFSLDC